MIACCPFHPSEGVRRFGDVLRCQACGEIVATWVGDLPADGGELVVPVAPGERYLRLVVTAAGAAGGTGRLEASALPTFEPRATLTRPPRPWRRAAAAWLRRIAGRLDP